MIKLGYVVGQLLKKLGDLGIADNTIVMFTTDNGAEIMTWPDDGNTPFHLPAFALTPVANQRERVCSFGLDQVIEKLKASGGSR